ncbi:hypothetical protein AmDm5_1058 [Acetobacter malorum]|uniref:Fucolectin tachylectin-4 pentraxin-1 n=1 Tax=Acetobacter malorum TaxID=178901 RepID=A0A087PS49_9PROT|nr:discoidin domain-containing protein [Acetobacter malorum]KFL90202.1 hypothetical protein AmDm5_1058 [Acetobacter malorum]OAG77628.1 fucolectin tachylectin-4 pentraxin-1 [Acetobacter malorum]
MSVTIAFRTHVWDSDIECIARKITGQYSTENFVILADETNGVLPTGTWPKVSHTSDFSEFGLPSIPAWNVLWHNGDYPLYKLLKEFPNSTHYIMIENDVLVNFDLDVLISKIKTENIDLIVHNLEPSTPEWGGHDSIKDFFKKPMKCLFPFIAISRRAVQDMLLTRQMHAELISQNNDMSWPYCEGFIPSTISELKDAKIKKLSDFCTTKYYDFIGCHHYLDSKINIIGSIAHPVRGKSFVQRRIDEYGVKEVFLRGSTLRRGLINLDKKDFYPVIRKAILATGSLDNVRMFNELALQEGWTMQPEAINWALGAEASQSSVSPFSHSQDPATDAATAVNGMIGNDYSFHTNQEFHPWWVAKMKEPVDVRHIVIYNRLIERERAAKIHVELSLDGQDWSTVASYPEGIIFGGADGDPLVIRVNGINAQYIKLTLLDTNYFHLNQVEVYNQ